MSAKRTPRTAAPAAKPTTGQEALDAGRLAYEEAASANQRRCPVDHKAAPRGHLKA
jgi:hypothetical protein